MKKGLCLFLALLLTMACLAGCGSSSASGGAAASGGSSASSGAAASGSGSAEYVWKMALNSSEGDNAYDTGAAFAEKVAELTNGKVKVDLYGGAALGSTSEILEGLDYGVADCMVESVSTLASFSNKANIDVMPYVYSGYDHWKAVWSSDLGQTIKDTVGKEGGFKLLGATYRNPRVVCSTYSMQKIEDFKGFKIRVPNLECYIKTWEWLKAAPTPMAMNEVYTALQQKTVDGQENPLADSVNYAFDEVCKYWIKTNHAYGTNVVIMSGKYFDSLPQDIQQACTDAANYASELVTGQALDKAAAAEQKLKDEGCTVIEVDMKSFIDYFDGFADTNFPYLSDWVSQIKEMDPNA